MLTREEVLATLRRHKPSLLKKYPIASLELFGSYSRNEQTPKSDVDILVEFSEPVGFEFVDLLMDLEKIFEGTKIDLTSKKAIKSHYKPYIEGDLINV